MSAAARAGAAPPPHIRLDRRFLRLVICSSSETKQWPKSSVSALNAKPAAVSRPNRSDRSDRTGLSQQEVLDRSEVTPRGVRDYIERSRELVRFDSGSPSWFSPLECAARAEGSPLLLYLPGIDGVGAGLVRHYERMGKIFDIWCLHIPVNDRTPFEGLVEYIEKTIKSEKNRLKNRPIYLLGESIGACIALAISARNQNTDFVLILVNPGTCFEKSRLSSLSDLVKAVPNSVHLTVPFFLDFISGNSMRMTSAYSGADISLEQTISALSESFTDFLPSLSFMGHTLPKETIIWKMKILKEGSAYVNSRLHAINSQTLVLASGNDKILPSREEAERLCSLLPNCRTRHFTDSSHTILLEGGIDLVTIIKGAGYYRRTKNTDFASDFLHPTPREFQIVVDEYSWINFASSPVMLSTLQNGQIVNGLSGIPNVGPAILIGYHMLMGLELGPLVIRFVKEKGILLRGIAHPFMFERNSEQLMPDYSSFDKYRIMGAVPVSGTNFYKLLANRSFVLLYPGGAREALHRKGEEYKLFWPEQSEFVRMGSRFGATIIPFGVVGEDDLYNLLLDYDDLKKIPLYDILDKRINEANVRLRANFEGEVGDQDLHPVVLTPKIPGRFYFLFGKPIETKGREKELREREKAQELYLHVKSEVEKCLTYLKERRERDPYRNILPRFLYQAIHGFHAQVPTFEP